MKKRRLILASLLVGILFEGCSNSGDAANPSICLESVKKVYPKAKIYIKPGERFIFHVVDSVGVRIVETKNITNANISDIAELIPIEKQ